MTTDDQAALVALDRKMARTTATAMQSAACTSPTATIDWAYGHEHIFMHLRALPEPSP
jgi:hypothetical protein